MAGKLTVTLRRSPIGEKPKTRLVVSGLGLGKLNSTRVLPDNASTRGAIHKVRHLVDVTEDVAPEEVLKEKPRTARKTAKKAPAKKAPAKKAPAKKAPAKKAPAKKATGK